MPQLSRRQIFRAGSISAVGGGQTFNLLFPSERLARRVRLVQQTHERLLTENPGYFADWEMDRIEAAIKAAVVE